MPLIDWSNGFSDTSQGHDLRMPWADYYGQFQMRHVFNLQVPVSGGGPGRRQLTRGFKYELWEDNTVVMAGEYELTLQVDWMAEAMFGSPLLSLVSFAVAKERFRTTIINGEPTSPVDVINSQTTSGKVTDYDGKELTPEEIDLLENPSWTHTLGRRQTSEFATVLLDTDRGLGTDTAILDGRVELPVYRQNTGPETHLDIVMDSMSGAGRADRYQFRAGGVVDADDISADVDFHGGIAIASIYGLKKGVQMIYNHGGEHYQPRGVIIDARNPSVMHKGNGRFHVLCQLKQEIPATATAPAKTINPTVELESSNGCNTFKVLQTIKEGTVTMPQAVTINPDTGETGMISFEGTALVFRRSGDNYAAKSEIANFKKPEPMALSRTPDGILRVQNGKGLVLTNARSGVGAWTNIGRVPVP